MVFKLPDFVFKIKLKRKMKEFFPVKFGIRIASTRIVNTLRKGHINNSSSNLNPIITKINLC